MIPALTGLSKEIIQQAIITKCGRECAKELRGTL